MKFKKAAVVFACLVLLSFLMSSCVRSNAQPLDILREMERAETSLPQGKEYFSGASEGKDNYFSPSLCAAMFGGGKVPDEFSLIESFALFIPTGASPCEFSVFRCYAASDTERIAGMCHTRLDHLRSYFKDTEFASYIENATVSILGKYVIMAVSSESGSAYKAAKKAIT